MVFGIELYFSAVACALHFIGKVMRAKTFHLVVAQFFRQVADKAISKDQTFA